MFKTVPSEGQKCNLIHCFNGQRYEMDEVQEEKWEKDEDMEEITLRQVSTDFCTAFSRIQFECVHNLRW